MNYAMLIIAHKNSEQLIKLIKSLKDEEIDVYVHLDKKWKISEQEVFNIEKASDNVTVLRERISGFLDTWSLCQIAIQLIKEAQLSGKNYSYYCLLSGQDYPIKSISYIKRYLSEQYPRPIIDCTPMKKDNWIYSGFKWIRFHRYYRFVDKCAKANKFLKKTLLLPAYAVQLVVTFIVGSPYKRLKKLNCELYGGSAWWILPDKVVEYCVKEVNEDSKIVKAFKVKNTPEETFFQTMAMRTELRDQVELNDPYEVLQNCMTYAYFFDDEHEPTGHPYILRKSNIEMLMNRKELLARKFDMNEDSDILQLIEEKCRGEKNESIDDGGSDCQWL